MDSNRRDFLKTIGVSAATRVFNNPLGRITVAFAQQAPARSLVETAQAYMDAHQSFVRLHNWIEPIGSKPDEETIRQQVGGAFSQLRDIMPSFAQAAVAVQMDPVGRLYGEASRTLFPDYIAPVKGLIADIEAVPEFNANPSIKREIANIRSRIQDASSSTRISPDARIAMLEGDLDTDLLCLITQQKTEESSAYAYLHSKAEWAWSRKNRTSNKSRERHNTKLGEVKKQILQQLGMNDKTKTSSLDWFLRYGDYDFDPAAKVIEAGDKLHKTLCRNYGAGASSGMRSIIRNMEERYFPELTNLIAKQRKFENEEALRVKREERTDETEKSRKAEESKKEKQRNKDRRDLAKNWVNSPHVPDDDHIYMEASRNKNGLPSRKEEQKNWQEFIRARDRADPDLDLDFDDKGL